MEISAHALNSEEIRYGEKVLFREQILDAIKFIVGSSYFGPENKNSH